MWLLKFAIVTNFLSFSLGAKLNEPKVLLPYFSKNPSSYQIEINDAKGCFTW